MLKRAITVALFGFFAGLAMLLSAGNASADVHICIPGYTDDNGAGVAALKAQQGYPCDETVQYSADLGLPGEVPAWQSIGEGAANTQAIVDRHPGEKVVVEGWSEGAIVANDYGNKALVNGALPSNVQLIQDDNGYASTGIINHPLAPVVLPFIGPVMGLPPADSIPPVPNSIHRYNESSAWGNMAPNALSLPTEIAMLATIPQNHQLNDPNTPHETFVGSDGVINEVYNVGVGPVPGVPIFPVTNAGPTP